MMEFIYKILFKMTRFCPIDKLPISFQAFFYSAEKN